MGAIELVAHWVFARRAPEPEAWAQVKAAVAPLRRNQELVVAAPAWADPLARRALGEELMPLGDVARPDATRYARAIEISILGQRSAELLTWREISRQRQGPFELRLLENPAPARVRFDFVDGLDPGRVRVSELLPEGERACPWQGQANVSGGSLHTAPAFPGRRFQCEGGEYFFVGVTVIDDERYRPRRCLWAHPSGPHPLRIRFQGVTLGSRVHGYGMLPWFMLRDAKGAPISLQIAVAGERLGTFVYRDGQGWTRFQFPTGKFAGRIADVDFEVSAESAANRHFCFQADTR